MEQIYRILRDGYYYLPLNIFTFLDLHCSGCLLPLICIPAMQEGRERGRRKMWTWTSQGTQTSKPFPISPLQIGTPGQDLLTYRNESVNSHAVQRIFYSLKYLGQSRKNKPATDAPRYARVIKCPHLLWSKGSLIMILMCEVGWGDIQNYPHNLITQRST